MTDSQQSGAGKGQSRNAIQGLLYGAGATGGRAVLQLIVLAVMARYLTPEDYGVVGASLVVVSFAILFSEFGVSPALVQRLQVSELNVRAALWFSLALAVLASLLLLISAPWLAEFFAMDRLDEVIVWYGLLFLSRGFSAPAEAMLQRDMKFKTLAAADFLSFLFGYTAVGIVLAVTGAGVWALVAANISQSILRTIIVSIARPCSLFGPCSWASLKDLLRFGWGQTLSHMASYAAAQGDSAIVGKVVGADALGIYGRAYQLTILPFALIGQVVDRVLFPVLARLQDDIPALRLQLGRSLAAMLILAAMLSTFLFIASAPIVTVLLGKGWEGVVPILEILSVAIIFRATTKVADSLAKATGWVYYRAAIQWVYALLVVGLGILGSRYGVLGIAIATVTAAGCTSLLMVGLALRIAELSFVRFLNALYPGLLAGGLTGLSLWLTRHWANRSELSLVLELGCLVTVFCLMGAFIYGIARAGWLTRDCRWLSEQFDLMQLLQLAKNRKQA